MTQRIQVHSRVSEDGVLKLHLPLGPHEANADVLITVEPLPATAADRDEWHRFVQATYGSCADLGLDEPADLPLPPQDWNQ